MMEEKARLIRILLDALPCVALLLRPGSREIVAANEAAAKSGAIPGSHCYDTWGRRKDPCPWCLAPAALTFFKPQHLEVEAFGIIWDAHWIPVDENLYMHYAFDITASKLAEKTLRESEARFHEIFENMTDGVAIYQAVEEGTDFVFKDINPAGAGSGKVERREVIGRSVREVFPGIIEMGLFKVFQEVYQTGKPKWHPVSSYKDDRISLWVENYVFKLPSGEIVALYDDLTEKKKAEERLQDSEEKFRHLVEAASEGICKVDENFTITYINRQMAEMLGYRPEEMLDYPIGNFLFPEDLANHISKKADRQKGIIEHYERRFRRKDGSTLWTIVSPQPLFDKRGRFEGSFAMFTDITERKRAEEALWEKQDQLRAMAIRMSEVEEAERKEMARTLHDLVGQNLTVLNLNLNIAVSLLPEKTKSVIAHRLEEAQKLGEEITQHIREVMSELRPSVLDDFGLVAALHWYGERVRVLTGLRINIEEKEFFPRLPSIMETIIFRIAQEALTNVTKHAEADQVDIILEKRSGKAHLTITDNGRGFVFKGFRLGGEKRGWGLATMKERAAALGGDLQVQSKPGKGTRLILQLPVDR